MISPSAPVLENWISLSPHERQVLVVKMHTPKIVTEAHRRRRHGSNWHLRIYLPLASVDGSDTLVMSVLLLAVVLS